MVRSPGLEPDEPEREDDTDRHDGQAEDDLYHGFLIFLVLSEARQISAIISTTNFKTHSGCRRSIASGSA